MSIAITGRHVAVTLALRRYVEEKVDRLSRFGLELRKVQVIISVEKFRHSAEVLCVFNRRQYRAKASSTEMYASIDLMMDKIDSQIRKKKERLVNHKRDGRRRPVPLAADEAMESARPMVLVSRPTLPRLSLEAAVEHLSLNGERYCLFLDDESQEVCLVRRLDDERIEAVLPKRSRARSSA